MEWTPIVIVVILASAVVHYLPKQKTADGTVDVTVGRKKLTPEAR